MISILEEKSFIVGLKKYKNSGRIFSDFLFTIKFSNEIFFLILESLKVFMMKEISSLLLCYC